MQIPFSITLFILFVLFTLSGCHEQQQHSIKEKAMFEWVTKLNSENCPQLSAVQYPKINPTLQALYDQALKLSHAEGHIDQVKISQLYKEAAEQGHWPSMHNFAVRYYQGNGLPEDEKAAFNWFNKMAEFNIPDGYTALANVYFQGIGTKEDPEKGFFYMDKAAQMGDPDAQFMAGKYLFSPLKRFKDSRKVLHCAVNQGHRDAAWELASQYEIVVENFDKAYEIYRKGAKLGSIHCVSTLSDAYGDNPNHQKFGLNQDTERAKCLFLLTRELRNNPDMEFDLDKNCPANVPQPPNRH